MTGACLMLEYRTPLLDVGAVFESTDLVTTNTALILEQVLSTPF